jgi:endogenous inhibitor of DNA gyrase (YacG/DUF329 family)
MKCPICKNVLKKDAPATYRPFCSARCRQIDLGKWLNEEYRVPVEETDESAEASEEKGRGDPPS